MAEISKIWQKDLNQIQKTPKRINSKKSISRHLIIQQLQIKEVEKN
jgi:hypothetical protein